MAYDENFYNEYNEYLKEYGVRKIHDKMFAFFDFFAIPHSHYSTYNVIDLGCGQSCEYGRSKLNGYYGFDLNAKETKTESCYYGILNQTYKLDYRENLQEIIDISNEKKIRKFVSLFSSEITSSSENNRLLYERLFSSIPTLEYGMVSGFYYSDQKKKLVIEEAGDVISWQTIDSVEDSVSELYDETRIYTRCPSKMFGDSVVEVWKFFERKSNG